jgi:hypothetical protein
MIGTWDRVIEQLDKRGINLIVRSVVWSLMVSRTLRGRFGPEFRRMILKEINQ